MDDHPPLAQAVTVHLDGATGSAATARRRTREFLQQLVPPVPAPLVRDAVLIVSEMVANAVRHAPGPCTLDLQYLGRSLVIGATDTATEVPTQRAADLDGGSGGFGMNLLDRMGSDTTVSIHPHGKTVTVTLDILR